MLRHSLMHLDCLTLLHNFFDIFWLTLYIVRCFSRFLEEMNSVHSVEKFFDYILDMWLDISLNFQIETIKLQEIVQ